MCALDVLRCAAGDVCVLWMFSGVLQVMCVCDLDVLRCAAGDVCVLWMFSGVLQVMCVCSGCSQVCCR